jgi:hypothetical protein
MWTWHEGACLGFQQLEIQHRHGWWFASDFHLSMVAVDEL